MLRAASSHRSSRNNQSPAMRNQAPAHHQTFPNS